MIYREGDEALYVAQEAESLRVSRVRIQAVKDNEAGQLVTVQGQDLQVNREGIGDHPGVSIAPLDDLAIYQLDGRDEFVVQPSSIDEGNFHLVREAQRDQNRDRDRDRDERERER